jgi:hypothetical protein
MLQQLTLLSICCAVCSPLRVLHFRQWPARTPEACRTAAPQAAHTPGPGSSSSGSSACATWQQGCCQAQAQRHDGSTAGGAHRRCKGATVLRPSAARVHMGLLMEMSRAEAAGACIARVLPAGAWQCAEHSNTQPLCIVMLRFPCIMCAGCIQVASR